MLGYFAKWLGEYLAKKLEPEPSDETKVIIVLNTDTVSTVQGPETVQELHTVPIPHQPDTGNIALRLHHFEQDNVSVLGHVDSNLLSFVMNILLSHNVKSIVMLKKKSAPIKMEQPLTEEEKQGIMVYEPSKAERHSLEERFL